MVKLPDPYALGAPPQAGRRLFARIDASPIAEGQIAQGRAVGRGGAAMAAAIGAGGEAFAGALGRDPMGRAVTEAGANLGAAQRRAGRELAAATERVGEAAARGLRTVGEAEGGAIIRGGTAEAHAIQRGAEMERRGFAQLGRGMQAFAKEAQDYIAADYRLDLHRAQAKFTSGLTILDAQADRDTDYPTLRERYDSDLKDLCDSAAAIIRSDRQREQFMLQSEPDIARSTVRVDRHIFKLAQQTRLGELDADLDNYAQAAQIRKEEDRGEIIARGTRRIDAAVAAGDLTPLEGDRTRKQWVERYATAWTEGRAPDERLGLLAAAREGKATGTPVDFLKAGEILDLHTRTTTELLQAQRRAASETALARHTVQQKIDDDVRSLANTGQGVAGLAADDVERLLGRDKLIAWQAAREDAHTIWVKTHDLSTLKDDALIARLTELEPAAGGEGDSRGQRIYDAVATKVAALWGLRRDDPAASVSDDPMVQDAAAAVDTNDPATWRTLVQARPAAQAAAGIPEGAQSPITRDEALTLTEPLRRAPPGEAPDALAEVTRRFDAMFGDHARRAFTDALRWSADDAVAARAVAPLLRKIGLSESLTQEEAKSVGEAEVEGALPPPTPGDIGPGQTTDAQTIEGRETGPSDSRPSQRDIGFGNAIILAQGPSKGPLRPYPWGVFPELYRRWFPGQRQPKEKKQSPPEQLELPLPLPPPEQRQVQQVAPFDGPASIADFRARQRDMFGHETMPQGVGTVAVANVNGEAKFGVNSEAPPYTPDDRSAADRVRGDMIKKYPDLLKTKNIGQKPNDALYHAEATLLLRIAGENGGTLAGQTLEIHVDGEMCPSCEIVLPLLVRELGSPTVTFIDDKGLRRTIRNGDWDPQGN